MAPKNAGSQPLISKPFITPAEILKITAFTTNVKRPKVIIFIGSVRNNRMGLNNMLNKPSIMAAIKALGTEVI